LIIAFKVDNTHIIQNFNYVPLKSFLKQGKYEVKYNEGQNTTKFIS